MKYRIEKDFTIYISAEIEAYNEEDALKEFEGLTEPLLVQLEEEEMIEVEITEKNKKVIDLEKERKEKIQDFKYEESREV